MTSIYHVGHEYGAVTANDSNTYETTDSAHFDSTYSRASLSCTTPGTLARTAAFSNLTEGYVRFRWNNGIGTTFDSYIYFLNASGTVVFRLNWQGDQVRIQYWNGTAWVNATSFVGISSTVQSMFDFYFKCSASGAVRLYSNGSLLADSGTLDLSSISGVAQVGMTGTLTVFTQFFSELEVSSGPTIGHRVATLYLTGAGATNTFTTGTYADVDEAVLTDSDGLTSATAGQIFTGTVNAPNPGNYPIKGLAVTARAKRDSTGPQNIQMVVRVGGTNYFSPTLALDVGYGASVYVWETNPATGVAWTATDLASVQIGVKSIA